MGTRYMNNSNRDWGYIVLEDCMLIFWELLPLLHSINEKVWGMRCLTRK